MPKIKGKKTNRNENKKGRLNSFKKKLFKGLVVNLTLI